MPELFRWLQGKCHVYCHSHTHPNLMSSVERVVLRSGFTAICLLPPTGSFLPDSIAPPCCGRSHPQPFFSLLLPSFHPSNQPFILPCFHGAYAFGAERSPLCGLTTWRLAASDLAWLFRRRSALSLSHGELYILTHTEAYVGPMKACTCMPVNHICTCT